MRDKNRKRTSKRSEFSGRTGRDRRERAWMLTIEAITGGSDGMAWVSQLSKSDSSGCGFLWLQPQPWSTAISAISGCGRNGCLGYEKRGRRHKADIGTGYDGLAVFWNWKRDIPRQNGRYRWIASLVQQGNFAWPKSISSDLSECSCLTARAACPSCGAPHYTCQGPHFEHHQHKLGFDRYGKNDIFSIPNRLRVLPIFQGPYAGPYTY